MEERPALERIALSMPNPEREARRAVSHLMRDGLDQRTAAWKVVGVIARVQMQLSAVKVQDNEWLRELYRAAHALTLETNKESGSEDDAGGRA